MAKLSIIIPAYNEEATIGLMLESLVAQTLLPKTVVVVNDNSTDDTSKTVDRFTKKNDWIRLINHQSSNKHIPGSKVINAFYKGLESLDENYDIICKFDADIILPTNYLETITNLFKSDPNIGVAGGLAYIKKGDNWTYETVASKNHVRGPFKAYRQQCFQEIGGLKRSIGWDTVDVLLAQYNNWKGVTDKTLHVKHLKPTGNKYTKDSKHLQGEALYKLRYDFSLASLSALKSAIHKKSFRFFFNTISGYLSAKRNKMDQLVTEKEGHFIRKLRWKGVKKSLGF